MIYEMDNETLLDNHLDCMGEFNNGDDVCRKHCALRLRCAIEHSQKARLELIEDIMASNDTFIKFQ